MTVPPTTFRGIACMVFAAGAFVANDSCMKMALSETPPLEALLLRGIAACLWCLPILFSFGHGAALPHVLNRWVVLRALSEVAAILAFIFALKHMPIADITAIVQIAPLLVLSGGALFWGDRIGPLRMVLIAFGIAGALLVAQPGSSLASPFAAFGFLTAIGVAGRDLATRKVDPQIPALVVTFATLVIVMAMAGLGSLLFETRVVPTPRSAMLLAVAGLLLLGGQLFVFLAFRMSPARVVAPFNYTSTVWAVIAGMALFSDFPDGLAQAGMVLIVVSGLCVILLEGRTRQGEIASPKHNTQVISN